MLPVAPESVLRGYLFVDARVGGSTPVRSLAQFGAAFRLALAAPTLSVMVRLAEKAPQSIPASLYASHVAAPHLRRAHEAR